MDKLNKKETDKVSGGDLPEFEIKEQITGVGSQKSPQEDAGIAEESANFIREQILQQVSSALISQANKNPEIALHLE